jgi:hypothetical protein
MRAKTTCVILLVLLLAPISRAAAFETITWRGHAVAAGQAMITLSSAAQPAQTLSRLAAHGFTAKRIAGRDGIARTPDEWLARGESPAADRFMLVEFPAARVLDDALAQLAALDEVTAVVPNQVLSPFFVPNDPLYALYQQNLRQIYLESVWDRTFGDGVTVAVVDTGYASAGLDDGALHLLPGYNFPDNDTDVADTDGHGTFVANVIAEATNNGIDTAGAAPNVSILPCKVFATGGSGALESDVTLAVDWAVKQGAQVINMSLGGSGYDTVAAAAMHDAAAANVVLVAATGNDGVDEVSYPAAYPDVMAVGSCGIHDTGVLPTRSSFSNYGQGLAVVAPGENIYGESNFANANGDNVISVYIVEGTSVSSPHVAAAAALMIAQAKGNYSQANIQTALEQTASRPANTQWNEEIGWGEINVEAAMNALVGPPPSLPSTGSGGSGGPPCGIGPNASPLDAAVILTPLAWLLARRRLATRRQA